MSLESGKLKWVSGKLTRRDLFRVRASNRHDAPRDSGFIRQHGEQDRPSQDSAPLRVRKSESEIFGGWGAAAPAWLAQPREKPCRKLPGPLRQTGDTASRRENLILSLGTESIDSGGQRMPGASHASGRSGALGRIRPAAPGDPNRRYMVAIVAIRTQQMIWEIMSTVKTTDCMPIQCTRSNPDATAQRR